MVSVSESSGIKRARTDEQIVSTWYLVQTQNHVRER